MSGERRKTVLIVDDEPRYRDLYAQVLQGLGVRVVMAGSVDEATRRLEEDMPDLVVSDVRMPGISGLEWLTQIRAGGSELPFLLVTAYAEVREAVSALKLGAVDYLAKPVDLDELVACVEDGLGLEANLTGEDPPAEVLGGMVAVSPAMRALLRQAWQVACGDVNVLVTGESGTGKEVIARLLHRGSARASAPFIPVNCAALPGSLLGSELFGHVKGAFTGATSARPGRFREAHGGVLFLDEIGDMPLELQPVLLRAIEQRTISPLGGTGEVPVDFRLIAATHRALETQIEEGTFRADLFYRLNVFSLHIPPLRERPEDIVPLARRFLTAAGGQGKRLARATIRRLQSYAWPGNVRELENAMERAHLLTRTDVIEPSSLPLVVQNAPKYEARSMGGVKTLKESERDSLRRALEQTGGNRTRAAEILGITRRGLLKKLKRLELEGDALGL